MGFNIMIDEDEFDQKHTSPFDHAVTYFAY